MLNDLMQQKQNKTYAYQLPQCHPSQYHSLFNSFLVAWGCFDHIFGDNVTIHAVPIIIVIFPTIISASILSQLPSKLTSTFIIFLNFWDSYA